MNMINVTPLMPGHEQEITDDLKDMYRRKIIRSAVFSFTMVPEGDPAIDKASRLAALYRKNVQLLQNCDMPVGILLQATMGMGWTPEEKAHYQKFILEHGEELYVFCPLDTDFLNFIRGQVEIAARERPAFVMVDDDTRMITGRGGCFCPLHIAEFNRRTGQDFTRESLSRALAEEPEKWRKPWDDLQRDSVVGLAKTIRAALDTVDPATPVFFCECGLDVGHAPHMIRALSAPGQKPVLRINNGIYLCDSLNWMPYWMMRTMWQVCALPKDYTLLAETDSCPQNRYSTAASLINLHYAWSTLVGCRGAKLWITQLSNYDPETGKPYRDMLASHAGFYDAITEMRPEWDGFAEVLPNTPEKAALANSLETWTVFPRPTWGCDVFSFMGIPFSFEPFGSTGKRTVLLSGEKVKHFDDEELRGMLSGNILLDGQAAIELTKRGFAELIGAHAVEWDLPVSSYEVGVDGTEMDSGMFMAHLKDLASGVEVRSTLYHKGFALAEDGVPVAPGMIRYRNSEGGNVTLCAAILKPHPDSGFSPFGMLRRNRKIWLTKELNVPVFYDGTASMYFCLFRDHGHLTAVAVNLGLDAENSLPVNGISENLKTVQMLQNDGTWSAVPVENGAIRCTLLPAQIAFFRFEAE